MNIVRAGSKWWAVLFWLCVAAAVFVLSFGAFAEDAPPPAAIDFSTFTPDTLEAYFRGLRAQLVIADERLSAQQRDSAAQQAAISKLTQDLGDARVANAGLVTETAKLQKSVDDMRAWGIEQQRARQEAEESERKIARKLRTVLGILALAVGIFVWRAVKWLQPAWIPIAVAAVASATAYGLLYRFL